MKHNNTLKTTLLLLTLWTQAGTAQNKNTTQTPKTPDLPTFFKTEPTTDRDITPQDVTTMIRSTKEKLMGIIQNINTTTAQELVNLRHKGIPVKIYTTENAVKNNKLFTEMKKLKVDVYYIPQQNSKRAQINDSMLINEKTILTGSMIYGKKGKTILIANEFTTPALIFQKLSSIERLCKKL